MFRVKNCIKEFQYYLKSLLCKKRLDIDWDNSIIFLLASDYNNVGDMLIKKAQKEFIEKNTRKKVVVVSMSETPLYIRNIKKNATKNTLVVLTGGGNTGDRFTKMERIRNLTIRVLSKKHIKIIGFPQTIDYSNTIKGEYYLNKAKHSYSLSKEFVLFAREKKSYNLARKYFSTNTVLLCPDIVFSINEYENSSRKREGIGTIFRSDSEKKLQMDEQGRLINDIEKKYRNITENDMTVSMYHNGNDEDYIKEKVDYVNGKKVIITDRLHGMILCYITKTPCVVISNNNHKISETYNNWLKDKQNYILFVKEMSSDNILDAIGRLMTVKPEKYNIIDEYHELRRQIASTEETEIDANEAICRLSRGRKS